jgi:hypothetical protein
MVKMIMYHTYSNNRYKHVAILLNVSACFGHPWKVCNKQIYNNGRHTTNKENDNGLHFIINNKMLSKSILNSHDA